MEGLTLLRTGLARLKGVDFNPMVRIQLDLPDDQVAELDKLMEETRVTTRKDLFNNALTLFLWAVKAKKAGRIIASVDEDHRIRELVMPSIENIVPAKTLRTLREFEPVRGAK